MKLKCSECGNKVDSSDKTCPICGYVLYDDVFERMAADVDEELGNVTEAELRKIRRESSKNVEKLTFSQFEEIYAREHGSPASNPLAVVSPLFYSLERRRYKRELNAAWREYRRSLGFDE